MERTNDQTQHLLRKAQCKEDLIHFQQAQPVSQETQGTRKLMTTNPVNWKWNAGLGPPLILWKAYTQFPVL